MKKRKGLPTKFWLGKKQPKEMIEKRVAKLIGKKRSEEVKLKLSEQKRGNKNPAKRTQVRLKISETLKKLRIRPPSRKGIKWSEEQIAKRSGEKSWNWKGGISRNLYPREFNSELKLKIRVRDNFTCCLCKRTEKEELKEFNRVLSINHIDFDKNNCIETNLNTLCVRCNSSINYNREFWTGIFKTVGKNVMSML